MSRRDREDRKVPYGRLSRSQRVKYETTFRNQMIREYGNIPLGHPDFFEPVSWPSRIVKSVLLGLTAFLVVTVILWMAAAGLLGGEFGDYPPEDLITLVAVLAGVLGAFLLLPDRRGQPPSPHFAALHTVSFVRSVLLLACFLPWWLVTTRGAFEHPRAFLLEAIHSPVGYLAVMLCLIAVASNTLWPLLLMVVVALRPDFMRPVVVVPFLILVLVWIASFIGAIFVSLDQMLSEDTTVRGALTLWLPLALLGLAGFTGTLLLQRRWQPRFAPPSAEYASTGEDPAPPADAG